MDLSKEVVLYGLKDYEQTIDKVIKELNYEHNYFNMKLILTESLSNAFNYGNNADSSKPIFLRYNRNQEIIKLEIEDLGLSNKNSSSIKETLKNVSKAAYENNMLDTFIEKGRGLFLIHCFSDNVEFNNNTLSILINTCNDGKRKGDIIWS